MVSLIVVLEAIDDWLTWMDSVEFMVISRILTIICFLVFGVASLDFGIVHLLRDRHRLGVWLSGKHLGRSPERRRTAILDDGSAAKWG